MLKQRLAESNHSIIISHQDEDFVNVLGGDNSKEDQHRTNMRKDIEDLNFLLFCLKHRQAIEANEDKILMATIG